MTTEVIDSWCSIKTAHDLLIDALRPEIEGSTDVPKPTGVLVAAVPAKDGTLQARSYELPGDLVSGLVEPSMKKIGMAVIGGILDPQGDQYAPGNPMAGWHPLAVLIGTESYVVSKKLERMEKDISSIQLECSPSEHPERRDALIVAIHTSAGTKMVIHMIDTNPAGHPTARTLHLQAFPSEADLAAQTTAGESTLAPVQTAGAKAS